MITAIWMTLAALLANMSQHHLCTAGRRSPAAATARRTVHAAVGWPDHALKQVHGMLVSMWGAVATLTVTF